MGLKYDINKVAETLQDLSKLFNCNINKAWEHYMHSSIKEQFTLNQVKDFIFCIKEDGTCRKKT